MSNEKIENKDIAVLEKWEIDCVEKIKKVQDVDNLILTNSITPQKAFDSALKNYRLEQAKVSKSKINLAFVVLRAYDYQAHTCNEEFKDFYDFTKKCFDMSKTNTSECLNVARRFGAYEYDGNLRKFKPLYKIDDKYVDFSFYQLYEMRCLQDEDIENNSIDSSVPVSRIKLIITLLKDKENAFQYSLEDVTEDEEIEENDADIDDNTMTPPVEIGNNRLVGRVNLDEIMDKPWKLDATKGGYIIRLDNDNNMVIEEIRK